MLVGKPPAEPAVSFAAVGGVGQHVGEIGLGAADYTLLPSTRSHKVRPLFPVVERTPGPA